MREIQMLYANLREFLEVLPPKGRLLGFDVGEKRVGIAMSDTTRTIATAYGTLTRLGKNQDVPKIRAIVNEHEICGMVIGLPRNMDGTEGKSCEMARQFGKHILKQWDIPVYFQDERLSTAAVTRALKEGEVSRKKRSELDDKLAAGYLLQTTLDSMKAQQR